MTYDVAIIGAGIVGLATAYQILEKNPSLKLCVIEKEANICVHQSGHNSGVIHSGIYYQPGSLRAQNCIRGYHMLLDFCKENEVDYDLCGKLIVATNKEEIPILKHILKKGIANGLHHINLISREEALEKEPYVDAAAAIYVPQAGIIHYPDVANKYKEIILRNGADIFYKNEVKKIQEHSGIHIISTSKKEIKCHLAITCGGLYSDRLAKMTMPEITTQILPFRGEYYKLIPEKEYLVKGLIYPVPNANFPFLGVHFTPMIKGGIEAGPNAVLAYRREGYTNLDFHFGELWETLSFGGFRKIARKYWRDGLEEMKRSYSTRAFVKALQKLIPEVKALDVKKAGAGVRAMACQPDGELADDYMIYEKKGVINVCNAPSPAATSSLAIGKTIADKAFLQLK